MQRLIGITVLAATLGATGAADAQSCYEWREIGVGPQWRAVESAIAYFPKRDTVVLLTMAEQWEWDGLTWTRTGDAQSYLQPAMAYDSARGVMVLVYGKGPNNALWEWDGGPDGWQLRSPGGDNILLTSSSISVVYDEARAVTLIVERGMTYVYDGVNVTKHVGGPNLSDGRAAYDPVRQRTVYFGGSGGGQYWNDTWEWDGEGWTLLAPLDAPPGRVYHSLAYDPQRGRIMLFGGASTFLYDDTWEWDGENWSRVYPDSSPSARSDHHVAYDAGRNEMLLFGGHIGGSQSDHLLFRRNLAFPVILQQPGALTVDEGRFAAFAVTAVGQGIGYQWLKDGVEIDGGTNASIIISAASLGDTGEYSVRVTGTCGAVESNVAQLTVNPVCHADFNGDGVINTIDFVAYLNAYTGGCP